MGSLADFYHYSGGLTTPPCNAGAGRLVRWVVAARFAYMSQGQLDVLKTAVFNTPVGGGEGGDELISTFGNARPQQCRGSRTVWYTGSVLPARGAACATQAADCDLQQNRDDNTAVGCPVTTAPAPAPAGAGNCQLLDACPPYPLP